MHVYTVHVWGSTSRMQKQLLLLAVGQLQLVPRARAGVGGVVSLTPLLLESGLGTY
jgi:hypothetical protein